MSDRPPLLQQMLDELSEYITGQPVSPDTCATCGRKIDYGDFKDWLSRREYEVSRMCQACQDKIFEGDEDEEEDYDQMLKAEFERQRKQFWADDDMEETR
jgi:hypothetical protein